MEEVSNINTGDIQFIKRDYKCPICNSGYLRPTGLVLLSMPRQYEHKCTNCDYTEIFRDKTYPYIDFI